MRYEAPAIEVREGIDEPLVVGYASPTWTATEESDGSGTDHER
jgi:hypothetical protein